MPTVDEHNWLQLERALDSPSSIKVKALNEDFERIAGTRDEDEHILDLHPGSQLLRHIRRCSLASLTAGLLVAFSLCLMLAFTHNHDGARRKSGQHATNLLQDLGRTGTDGDSQRLKCSGCNGVGNDRGKADAKSYSAVNSCAQCLFKISGENQSPIFSGDCSVCTSLDLSGQGIASLAAGAFSGMTQLHALNLANNALTKLGAEDFAGLEQLQHLDLSGNDISSFSLATFHELPLLESLDLSSNALGEIPCPACFTQLWGDCTYSCCKAGLTCFVQEIGYAQCIQGPCPQGWDCTIVPSALGSRQQFWQDLANGELDPTPDCTLHAGNSCGISSSNPSCSTCASGLSCVQQPSGRFACEVETPEPVTATCVLGFYSECTSGCCVDGYQCQSRPDLAVIGHNPAEPRCLPVSPLILAPQSTDYLSGSNAGEAGGVDAAESCVLEPGAACGFGLGCCRAGYECAVKDGYPQCYPSAGCGDALGELAVCELNGFTIGCCAQGLECETVGEVGRCREQPPAEGPSNCRIRMWDECTPAWTSGCCRAGSVCAIENRWWAMCVPANRPCPRGHRCQQPQPVIAAPEEEVPPRRCDAIFANSGFESTSQVGWRYRSAPSGAWWNRAAIERAALTIVVDPHRAFEGNSYLLVHNRSETWQAPQQTLDKTCLSAGVTYQFSAAFRLPAGAKCFTQGVGCPEVYLRLWNYGEELYKIGEMPGGQRDAWNEVSFAFRLAHYHMSASWFSVRLLVKDVVDFEVDSVIIKQAPAGTIVDAPLGRHSAEDPSPTPAPIPTPDPSPTPDPGSSACNLVKYDDCHNPSRGCCTAGLLCYRANGWFSQCREPGTCFDHWDCSVTSLDNPPLSVDTAFGALGNLKKLELQGNQLVELPDRAFTGLTELRRLDLHNNEISQIGTLAFYGLWKVEHLELSDNRIQSMDWRTLSQLLSVTYFGLFYNPLRCLPLFPETVRSGGVSYQQAVSLTGCLPRACSQHVQELLPGFATGEEKSPLVLEHVRAMQFVMMTFRSDARRSLDAVNRDLGLYVTGGGSERIWCMGGSQGFDIRL